MVGEKTIPLDKPILLFDGVCNLCHGFVQTVIRLDPKAKFRFASLQSGVGQYLLKKHNLPLESIDTVVLVNADRAYTHSDVALQASLHLGGLWKAFYIFTIIPRPIRNSIYNWIAKNRYNWFGKKDSCMIPTPELRDRFLDD